MSVDVFRSIQHQMESFHSHDEVEGNVAFMNLVRMSNPLVLFLLSPTSQSKRTPVLQQRQK
jgi:hypothetical protein